MNIKEKIGERIFIERKAKGLTRKALAELTGDLKQSRINNWERGYRTPGPAEIKQLAKVLDVSPAYLMCLTDDKHNMQKPVATLVPLLDLHQAHDHKLLITSIENDTCNEPIGFIPIAADFAEKLSNFSFAIKMGDDSMHPALQPNDILIIDPEIKPRPGSLVIAALSDEHDVLVRRYKQLSTSKEFCSYELISENPNWANTKIDQHEQGKLVGVVVCVISYRV